MIKGLLIVPCDQGPIFGSGQAGMIDKPHVNPSA